MTTRTTAKDPSQKGSLGRFLKGVKSELGKVNWPTRKELMSYVGIVLGMCLILSVLLGIFDSACHKLIETIFGVK